MSEKSKLSSRFKKIDLPKLNKFENQLNQKMDISPEISEISVDEVDFRKSLLEKIEKTPVWFEYSKERRHELIKSFVENKLNADKIQLADIDKELLIDNLKNSVNDFGAIQHLIDNENVTAVYVNGMKSVYVEIGCKILNTETSLNYEQFKFLIGTLTCMTGVEKFENIQTFRLENYLLTIAGDDVCDSINIMIKKQRKFVIEDLLRSEVITKEIFDFLVSAVNMRKNIVISGCVNSGKTTLLDVLLNASMQNKRVYVIENTPQLSVNFDTMSKFKGGLNSVSYILKSSPEYLVCDLNYIEPEFVDFKGMISTLRANSAEAAIQNLIGMCVVGGLPEKFAKIKALTNFDYIVHLERMTDGSVKVVYVLELVNAKTMQASIKTVFKFADGEFHSNISKTLSTKFKKNHGIQKV